MNVQANTPSSSAVKSSELGTARFVALSFAALMLFTVGFAQATPLHNAAHDTRHVQVFPCH